MDETLLDPVEEEEDFVDAPEVQDLPDMTGFKMFQDELATDNSSYYHPSTLNTTEFTTQAITNHETTYNGITNHLQPTTNGIGDGEALQRGRNPFQDEFDGLDQDDGLFATAFGRNNAVMADPYGDDFMDVSLVKVEHTNGCNGTRSLSTPPSSPIKRSSSTEQTPDVPLVIQHHTDVSRNLLRHHHFHQKASRLIPRIPLATHRYWIGVLNIDKSAKNAKAEKDFTWMKGNRLTTMETVWQMYHSTTASTDFVLLYGAEVMEKEVQAQDLDGFKDKCIILKAVSKFTVEGKGRRLTEEVVPPEVIDIDDD